jgi:hypothetical protein
MILNETVKYILKGYPTFSCKDRKKHEKVGPGSL